ncbi:glycoside hydrolase [Gracilibacillus salitolerans]|uniref:Glycoside hydrolase n=2 Tax=Gracilibacillus salitolerans TaxID=2663022 RepID=A0A5Q2TMM5_9BACI|nr:glycoside hydrolase [Gracilibacillus salitolerans]
MVERKNIMQIPKKKWKIFVIHHSHTDIGYTERQEKIESFHVDYIKQAIEIINKSRDGSRPEWKGFKWTCETFWAVEKFLEQASPETKEQFMEALQQGDIELSGTYLNMTELIDYDILKKLFLKAKRLAEATDVPLNSAMTADINGYSWGYSQAMYDAGIRNLLSCVHTHHGMYAIGRKQLPFYWETPTGDKLLVWNGEHYMLGNELGISPGAVLSYSIRDEFETTPNMENHWEMAETRIMRYLCQLEKEDYPYDFALVNVMGLLRDNAAPNGKIMDFIHRWNSEYGNNVEIEMTTLNTFFDHVKNQEFEIPVYKGDWPDWWSDGVASTAMNTQIFRDAQRNLRLVKNLDQNNDTVSKETIENIEHQLTMYAEHTWGYHSSVYEPWHPMVQSLEVRKAAYAANASRMVFTALDHLKHTKGEALLSPERPFRYKVVNPFDHVVEDIAHIYLDGWEPSLFKNGFEVIDEQTGEVVPHQMDLVSEGNQISIVVKLQKDEEKIFSLRETSNKAGLTTQSTRLKGNDGVYDMENLVNLGDTPSKIKVTETGIESPFARIKWQADKGIYSWIDKNTGNELLRDEQGHAAFTPVYEVTPAGAEDQMAEVRRKMGRNRKGMDVQRSIGTLTGVKEISNGELYCVVELLYKIEGMSHYSLFLKVYHDLPRVDVSVRIHKDSVWDPENVYISMPFCTGNRASEELWLEKAGALIRPAVDQLPGTGTDYYSIQEGLAYISEETGLLIATPDTPLVQLGPLEHGQRLVHGQQTGDEANHLYAWPLTNYWETNFKGTLGGFYEFRYIVQWGDQIDSADKAIQLCQSLNIGTTSFRLNKLS